MCLAVDANGSGAGNNTHVSVFAHLMAGENDDDLEWPLRGAVTISILNQRGNHHHVTNTITFSDGVPDDICARVVSGRVAEKGYGNATFIAHVSLVKQNDTEYLSNNSLRLRIEQFTSFSSSITCTFKVPSWELNSDNPIPSVAEFTMSEFSKHKAIGGEWRSAPFYTHPQGYKFGAVVRATGHSGEYTYVGVQMMKGEYDDSLAFPFRGVFTVEIINWLQDEHHIQHTIHITDDTDGDHRAGGRVTSTSYAPVAQFIDMLPHSSLPHNPTTNTQYLDDDDCMRIRVTKVDVDSLSIY